jgi:integrase
VNLKHGGTHYRLSLDKHLGRHIDNKTDAECEAEKVRVEIRADRFGKPAALPRSEVTLRQLADVYLRDYVRPQRASTHASFEGALRTICRVEVEYTTGGTLPLGDWRVADITTRAVESFRTARHAQGLGTVGTNRLLGHLRAMYGWALRTGEVDASPFTRGGQAVVKLAAERPRTRRLNADTDEEGRLLQACGSHLRAVVECALQAGMRLGEILSLQWREVVGLTVEGPSARWAPRAEIIVLGEKAKTRTERHVPISSRLRAILETRRHDPSGEPHALDAYVFGNELGQPVASIKRAWMTAVLRAHGRKPRFTKTGNFEADSRSALDEIDLHVHDLRREAGSRWLEGGVPLHVVRDWLGHTSIQQTSTYLGTTIKTQHDAMAQFEVRRVSLQQFATGVGEGHQTVPRADAVANKRPNEPAVGRESTIM